jgi:hypothetical protein
VIAPAKYFSFGVLFWCWTNCFWGALGAFCVAKAINFHSRTCLGRKIWLDIRPLGIENVALVFLQPVLKSVKQSLRVVSLSPVGYKDMTTNIFQGIVEQSGISVS